MGISDLSIVREKHKSGIPLDLSDKIKMEKVVDSLNSVVDLESILYIYGFHFGYSEKIFKICLHYIRESPVPTLTATCFQLVCDHWALESQFVDDVAAYLKRGYSARWSNELIFCYKFARRNSNLFDSKTNIMVLEIEQIFKDQGILDYLDS